MNIMDKTYLGTTDALNYIITVIFEKLDKSVLIVKTNLNPAKALVTLNPKILPN